MQLPHIIGALGAVARPLSDFDSFVHALVVVVVVGCATGLRAAHMLDEITVGNIYAGAIGYAAGRSGVSSRVRSTDLTAPRSDQGQE